MNVALKLPPGFYNNGTREQAENRWYTGSLVRFKDNTLIPWKGWRPLLRAELYLDPDYLESTDYVTGSGTIVGSIRSALAWRMNDGTAVLAFGTESHLYIYANGTIYDITPVGLTAGLVDTAAATGAYGAGAYGAGPYGMGDAASESYTEAAVWRLDTFGEQLLAVLSPSDEKLYVWEGVFTTPAIAVAGAPTDVRAVSVTEERHAVVLGKGNNPRRVDWASQESLADWTASAINTAGGFELATTGRIMCSRRVRGGTLILTDLDSHLLEYVGPPFVYGRRRLGAGGIIGPNAIAVLDSGATWMGLRAFYHFDGVVQPVPCDVADYVFNDFNVKQGVKVAAVHDAVLGSVTWYYPSSASTENDRYVTWNYREDHWTTGILARAAGVDRGPYEYPILFHPSGTPYEHEVDYDYGAEGMPYIESGPFKLDRGDRLLSCRKLIPDEKTLGDVQATFYVYDHPTSTETAYGPYAPAEQTYVRFTARRIRIRLDGVREDDWRWGHPLLEVVPAGMR